MTTTDRNSQVDELLQQSRTGETHKERVLAKNEAISLMQTALRDDLYLIIPLYKGHLSLDGLLEAAEEVYGEVMLDEGYEPVGTEEIL